MTTSHATDFHELARLLVEAVKAEADHDAPEVSIRRLQELPRDVGVLLASVGVLGLVLPGIAGTPALIAGGLVLWPKSFGKVEGWLSQRFPKAHRASMEQVGRFLDDLDRRYPRK
jgi:hypothetical protein